MKKRQKPAKRKRLTPSMRAGCRVFRVQPDPDAPFHVEVRIARTRAHMHAEQRRLDGITNEDQRTMGLVRHWTSRIAGRFVIRPRGMVARMYLNAADLRDKPSEIVAHECTHAGMAWARIRGANLRHMPGEEVLCHATGRMVAQVNRICYASRVWE